jgi:hypothetical protein
MRAAERTTANYRRRWVDHQRTPKSARCPGFAPMRAQLRRSSD